MPFMDKLCSKFNHLLEMRLIAEHMVCAGNNVQCALLQVPDELDRLRDRNNRIVVAVDDE